MLFRSINRDDVMSVADRFGVPGAVGIVEQVLAAVDEWPNQAADAGVPEEVAHGVAANIGTWSKRLR